MTCSLIVCELNKLSKWVILHDIQFIGHEKTNTGFFTIIRSDNVTIHLEMDDDITCANCFIDDKVLLSTFGTTEYCLIEIDKIL